MSGSKTSTARSSSVGIGLAAAGASPGRARVCIPGGTRTRPDPLTTSTSPSRLATVATCAPSTMIEKRAPCVTAVSPPCAETSTLRPSRRGTLRSNRPTATPMRESSSSNRSADTSDSGQSQIVVRSWSSSSAAPPDPVRSASFSAMVSPA